MIIILFGPPGVGKNYIGNILKNYFDFFFYDGDELITGEMKSYIKEYKDLPERLAKKYIENKRKKFIELELKYPKLVLSEPLLQRPAQKYMFDMFPNATFIKITCPINLVYRRINERKDHFINDIRLVEKFNNSFEEPGIPHKVLLNDKGVKEITDQLKNILKNL